MSQEIFFLKMEWLMNASFFPEQLKHCVGWAAWVQKAGRLSFVLLLTRRRPFLVNWGPGAVRRWSRDGSSKGRIWVEFILPLEVKRLLQARDQRLSRDGCVSQCRSYLPDILTVICYLKTHLSKAEGKQLSHWHGMQSDDWAHRRGLTARHWVALTRRPVCGGPAFARLPVLFSLQFEHRGPGRRCRTAAATFSWSLRCHWDSTGIMNVSFLTIWGRSRLSGI